MFPRPIEKYSFKTQVSYRVLVYVALIIWLIPLAAIALTSIRSIQDINIGNYWGWPSTWEWSNYIEVFQKTNMGRFLLNSVIITIPALLGAIALSTLSGYALSQYKFFGNVFFFLVFVGGNFIPYQILMIPVRNLFVDINLYNSYYALIIFHIAFQSGFCTFFMYNSFSIFPKPLIESARMEGVGEFKIFWYIALPIMRPSLAALGVLVFTFIWNDYFWALILVQSDQFKPITSGLESLKGQWLASWQLLSAGAIVASMIPVAVFFFLQRHFISGLTLGSMKG